MWVYTRVTHAFRPLLRPLLIGINRYQIYRETHNSTRPRWHVERKLAATRVYTHERKSCNEGRRARACRRGIVYIVILCTSPRWIWIRGQRATGSSIYAANSVKHYLPNRRGIGEKCAREARRIASHASPPSQIRRVFSSLVTEIESRAKIFEYDPCAVQWNINQRISICISEYLSSFSCTVKWIDTRLIGFFFLNNRYLSF